MCAHHAGDGVAVGNADARHAERVRLKDERITHWLSQGAVATDRVAKFLGKAGLAPMPAAGPRTAAITGFSR